MRVLVTNDDGVDARGLHVLAGAMVELGHDVVVAAPMVDMSGFGAALGRLHVGEHIDTHPVRLPDHPDVMAFAVDGPPALAVMAACLGGFGDPPELIVSGINPGPNTGRSTLHSGTVGAALTGANLGLSGLAVSIGTGPEILWETAAALAASAVTWVAGEPRRTVVNLNVPNLSLSEVRGVRWARLAPFGTVRAALVESGDGRLQMEFATHDEKLSPDTDTALVDDGYAAVTSITGIRATDHVPVAEAIEGVALSRTA